MKYFAGLGLQMFGVYTELKNYHEAITPSLGTESKKAALGRRLFYEALTEINRSIPGFCC
jgi:hypothetical protein